MKIKLLNTPVLILNKGIELDTFKILIHETNID